MKVNSFNNNNISFNGFYNGKPLKKLLGFAECNGALFMSATSLALASTVRPISIMSTPKTDKENKKIACTKALASTVLDFIITLAVSIPIVKSIGRIKKAQPLNEKSEQFISQMIKLGAGLVIAVPKGITNVFIMPWVNKLFFKNDRTENTQNSQETPIFKGKNKKIDSLISKIFKSRRVKNFADKHYESNLPMHINALKDSLTTASFALTTLKTDKTDSERKGALIYNSIIATGLSILLGYTADFATRKPAEKFIKKLTETNKNDPNLKKYIEGFKIAKPTFIMGLAYYAIIPLISTFTAERIDKKYPI